MRLFDIRVRDVDERRLLLQWGRCDVDHRLLSFRLYRDRRGNHLREESCLFFRLDENIAERLQKIIALHNLLYELRRLLEIHLIGRILIG